MPPKGDERSLTMSREEWLVDRNYTFLEELCWMDGGLVLRSAGRVRTPLNEYIRLRGVTA